MSALSDITTFARTGTATFVDSNGVLQTAATGIPRTAHHLWDGSAWVNAGLLLESEARTNLFTYSEDFTDASWVKSATTVTANATTAPDGTLTADKIVATSTNSTHSVRQNTSFTSGLGFYAVSAYFKESEYRYAWISDTAFSRYRVAFDLQDLTVTQSVGSSVMGFVSASITDAGNGWRRCSCVLERLTADSAGLGLYTAPVGTSDAAPGAFFTGDDTSGGFLWGAQVEAGSTPSSYIPTTGTTVTRNAETLTIAAADAPWPEPVVIGPELVTNGDLSSGTSGWLAGANTTLSVVGGALRIEAVANGSASASQALTGLTVGAVYKISFDCVAETQTTGSPNYRAFGEAAVPVTAGVSYEAIIVADNTSESITFSLGGAALSGEYLEVDNVSVQEINPLSVSIQMEGTVTYTNENDFATAIMLNWQANATNLIQLNLATFTGTGGSVFFVQQESGVQVAPFVTDVYASAGINVPFNIASRHGTTFINGAVDGTALTANTTPTALPDLSAADIDIGPTFMGTIKLFRMWAEDIGDAGIASAST